MEAPIREWGSSTPRRQQPKDFIWPKKNIVTEEIMHDLYRGTISDATEKVN